MFADNGAVVGNHVITKSEDEIRREYYPYWRDCMINKYGAEAVARDWSFEDCLEDWVVVNWAWSACEERVRNNLS